MLANTKNMKFFKKIKSKKWLVLLFFSLILIVAVISISLAWFTKNTDDDNFSLNFAKVSVNLKDSVTNSKTINVYNSAKTPLLPGDTIYSDITVENTGDVDCYYIVCFKCEEINLNKDFYFSNAKTLISNSQNKALGILKAGEEQTLNLEGFVDTNFSLQNITTNFSCTVFAIQTKNITQENAYAELINLKNTAV